MKKRIFILLLGMISLSGVSLILLSTSRWGVILGNGDGDLYLLMARLFENYHVNKNLLVMFSGNVQPLFPLILSWGHLIGIEPHDGARWFNAILFGLNIMLIGIVTHKYARSSWLGISAALLMALAPDILQIHVIVQNEPLFISFMLACLLLFLDYFKNPKLAILILSSIMVTFAVMTRFAGIPMVMAGVIAILFLNEGKKLADRIVHAFIFVSVPCLCILLSYNENHEFQRHFVFHPVGISYFREMASVFGGWFFPPGVFASANTKLFLLMIGLAFCSFGLWRWLGDKGTVGTDPEKIIFRKFSILVTVFACLYVASLIIAAIFFDAAMSYAEDLDSLERYLILAHILGIIMFCGIMSRFFQKHSSFLKKNIGKMIIAYFLLFYTGVAVSRLLQLYILGDEYSMNPCRFSYTMRVVKTLPEGTPIYSNNVRDLFTWTDRISYPLPFIRDRYSLVINHNYLIQLFQVKAQFRKNKGILVIFNPGSFTIQNLQKKTPLHLMAQDKFASIFDAR